MELGRDVTVATHYSLIAYRLFTTDFSCVFAVRGRGRATACREFVAVDLACQRDGKMLPYANYERVPEPTSTPPVFGSMLVNDNSNTPYSDATQVRNLKFVDFDFGCVSVCVYVCV